MNLRRENETTESRPVTFSVTAMTFSYPTVNKVKDQLVALLPCAVEECVEGGSEVLADFLLRCKNHDS